MPQEPNVVKKFLDFVEHQKKECSETSGINTPWFRGQRNATWELLPAILRTKHKNIGESAEQNQPVSQLYRIIAKEKEILYKFRREGSAFVKRSHTNIEWYHLAQHHGLPTRLLDWTENPIIALWFALQTNEQGNDSNDACIYSINPERYGTYTSLLGEPITYNSREKQMIEEAYIDYVFGYKNTIKIQSLENFEKVAHNIRDLINVDNDEELLCRINHSKETYHDLNGKIIPLSPVSYNERQSRQASFFTLHLPNMTNFFVDDSKQLEIDIEDKQKFIIDKKEKPELRRFLETQKFHRWNIFPDLDNLAKGLIEEDTGNYY